MERFHRSAAKRKRCYWNSLQLTKRFAVEAVPWSIAYWGLKM